MNWAVRLLDVTVCVIGLGACGSVQSPGGGPTDAATDGKPIDAPDIIIDVPPPSAASCAGLPATCGAGSNDNCCNSPLVRGGTYFRSFDAAADPDTSGTTEFPASLSDFRLDKYEVTVGRFRAFVNAGLGTQNNPPVSGAGAHSRITASGWDASWNTSLVADKPALLAALKCDAEQATWTDAPAGAVNEKRPINCISWFEAMAFCAWDSAFLPTEAEWNLAAAGGVEQRAFPWSNPPSSLLIDGMHASFSDGTDCFGDGQPGCALTDILAVGSLPMGNGRFGQSDLSGNVQEWTLDWAAVYLPTCSDCANLAPAAHRTKRGGSYAEGKLLARTGQRVNLTPAQRNTLTGVRCARPMP
jgi:formylglycine-generating enzyme required for sulfatase activity